MRKIACISFVALFISPCIGVAGRLGTGSGESSGILIPMLVIGAIFYVGFQIHKAYPDFFPFILVLIMLFAFSEFLTVFIRDIFGVNLGR
jgi:hypothetical protein